MLRMFHIHSGHLIFSKDLIILPYEILNSKLTFNFQIAGAVRLERVHKGSTEVLATDFQI